MNYLSHDFNLEDLENAIACGAIETEMDIVLKEEELEYARELEQEREEYLEYAKYIKSKSVFKKAGRILWQPLLKRFNQPFSYPFVLEEEYQKPLERLIRFYYKLDPLIANKYDVLLSKSQSKSNTLYIPFTFKSVKHYLYYENRHNR